MNDAKNDKSRVEKIEAAHTRIPCIAILCRTDVILLRVLTDNIFYFLGIFIFMQILRIIQRDYKPTLG